MDRPVEEHNSAEDAAGPLLVDKPADSAVAATGGDKSAPTKRRRRVLSGFDVYVSLTCTVLMLAITAWYYWKMVSMTDQMQKSSVFASVHTEYASSDILDAIQTIEDFVEEHSLDEEPYYVTFLRLKYSHDPRGRQLDHARRKMVSWFMKVRYFYDLGYLPVTDPSYVEKIPGKDRARFLSELVGPLDDAVRLSTGRTPRSVFEFFREMYSIPSENSVSHLTLDNLPPDLRNMSLTAIRQGVASARQRRLPTATPSIIGGHSDSSHGEEL
ncbi:hypothetical protein Pmar_PMAR003372 [Perkinsus marinus ATCC 50983]|uniref:Transmembrane protein n=1 Tax=Perkinsus marinus (strain ATCC 50983 / TXsc) TaxID=423536 RepID=C5KH53_PERM5|nr:hypothetical protein Pmar_PMAR003372 [Perkinsus marinus ATCC 50983]EER15915.1 hypothetical protein Pmar_PMAR003372 [Perkinsus marinus ATCC 50983]|eukprot:XP_002784119.1 hypothetical protein Pmar_PMAR003372 [Perkinsus marinus ATCC 50983]